MLVDAFMFHNEFEVLELRLTLLDKYVDKFILVESEVNHAGNPKELFFHQKRDRYSQWLHKIEHVIVTAEESPKDSNPWSREKYQRECILRGLECVPDESIVMISDVDEIPNLETIPWEKLPHLICSVHMWMFTYSLDYMCTKEPWIGTVITTCEMVKKNGPNSFRDARWRFPVFQYAGWHLSSFGGPERVLLKLNSFAHCNDPHDIPWDLETFEKFVPEGTFADGTKLLPRPPDVPLPASIDVLRKIGIML